MHFKKIVLLPIIGMVACGPNPEPVKASIFENIDNKMDFFVGQTFEFKPIIKNGYESKNNFIFENIDNSNLIDISTYGTVSFYYEGTSRIKIISDDNFNGILDNNELSQVVTLVAKKPDDVVECGDIYMSTMCINSYLNSYNPIEVIALPNSTTYKKIKLISSNPSVCSITNDGMIYSKSVGDAVITAFNDINNNNVLDSDEMFKKCFVNVKTPEVTRTITFDQSEITLKVGEQLTINPHLQPNAFGAYYGYRSSNKDVCIVGNKNNVSSIRGVFPGKAKIEFSYEGAFGYIDVTVINNISAQGLQCAKIQICDQNIVMKKGESYQLHVNKIPSDCSNIISFTSNNENIVVDNNGKITAFESGNAIITVKSDNGKRDSINVTVVNNELNNNVYFDNYYGDLTWENGEDLTNKLHEIINNDFTKLVYTSNWETNSYADEYITNHDYVNLIYSNEPLEKSSHGTGSNVWQREHCFAASLLMGLSTGPATSQPGRATDFHNLYAAFGAGNSSRGNKNFGLANIEDPYYNQINNYSYDKLNFEPGDIDKGKVARAIFYMAVMYNAIDMTTAKESWTFITEEDISSHKTKSKTLTFDISLDKLELTEQYIDFDRISIDNFMAKSTPAIESLVDYYSQMLKEKGTTYKENTDEFRRDTYALYVSDYSTSSIGNLSTLLKWNSFKVDAQEIQHNNVVYSHVGIDTNKGKKQGNRNPFVDYPELVNYIFGDLKNTPGSIKTLTPSIINN